MKRSYFQLTDDDDGKQVTLTPEKSYPGFSYYITGTLYRDSDFAWYVYRNGVPLEVWPCDMIDFHETENK